MIDHAAPQKGLSFALEENTSVQDAAAVHDERRFVRFDDDGPYVSLAQENLFLEDAKLAAAVEFALGRVECPHLAGQDVVVGFLAFLGGKRSGDEGGDGERRAAHGYPFGERDRPEGLGNSYPAGSGKQGSDRCPGTATT